MSRYRTPKGEHRFRLIASLAGLALVATAVVIRGGPKGPASFDAIVIGGGFFLVSALWSARVILRQDEDDG